jgi:hypothetical protein
MKEKEIGNKKSDCTMLDVLHLLGGMLVLLVFTVVVGSLAYSKIVDLWSGENGIASYEEPSASNTNMSFRPSVESTAYDTEVNSLALTDEQLRTARLLSSYIGKYSSDEDFNTKNEKVIMNCLYNSTAELFDGDTSKALDSFVWQTKDLGITYERAALAVKNFEPDYDDFANKTYFFFNSSGEAVPLSTTEMSEMMNNK